MHPFNPLDYPIIFTSPARTGNGTSAWLGHLPFGMFVVEALQPRMVVELGTHLGASYCAFCQAVAALHLDTRCYAVDTWRGDTHSGDYNEQVLADLKRHHDPLYGEFSTLLRSTFDEALAQFPDASIDLLHIDGFHTYEAVRHDFETWLPKLSDRAVVLFHDTNVREGDFGVWKLWDEVRTDRTALEMPHSHGLGVLVVGANCPEALRGVLELPEADLVAVRAFFAHAGAAQHCRGELERIERTARKLRLWKMMRLFTFWSEGGPRLLRTIAASEIRKKLGRAR